MLTSRQIREARHMLGWGRDRLCAHAKVSEEIVQEAETPTTLPDITLFHLSRIQIALERAGIRFGANGAVLMSILQTRADR